MIGLLNFKKTSQIYREIKNFFFILSVIDRNKNTKEWKSFGLRSDWIGRIYTVINLRDEDLGEEDQMKRLKVTDRATPIFEYLSSLQLSEIVIPNISPVEDSRSYLLMFVPYCSQLSYIWMGMNIFLPLALVYEFLIKLII